MLGYLEKTEWLEVRCSYESRSGSYSVTSGDDTLNRAEALKNLDRLEQDKIELQNKLAKEKQMGRQVEMTNTIKNIADQINDLKERL